MEEVWLALYTLSQISFRNSSRVSNSLDPDKVCQNAQKESLYGHQIEQALS